MYKTINAFINISGAITSFFVFSFHELLSLILTQNNDYHYFLLPWWGWGSIGFVVFEIVYILIFIKKNRRY